MIIIEHRVNTIAELEKVPHGHGVEIDLRHDNRTGGLYLNHDPGEGEDFEEYLSHFRHAFLVMNIKEAGIEGRAIEFAQKHGIGKDRYFLLDVEFPYFYRASRKEGVREIAVRYSEAEPLAMALAQAGSVDWGWIDTNTVLPIDRESAQLLGTKFKTCLVSPDRWRPERAHEEIPAYRKQLHDAGLSLDAVMAGKEFADLWSN